MNGCWKKIYGTIQLSVPRWSRGPDDRRFTIVNLLTAQSQLVLRVWREGLSYQKSASEQGRGSLCCTRLSHVVCDSAMPDGGEREQRVMSNEGFHGSATSLLDPPLPQNLMQRSHCSPLVASDHMHMRKATVTSSPSCGLGRTARHQSRHLVSYLLRRAISTRQQPILAHQVHRQVLLRLR